MDDGVEERRTRFRDQLIGASEDVLCGAVGLSDCENLEREERGRKGKKGSYREMFGTTNPPSSHAPLRALSTGRR